MPPRVARDEALSLRDEAQAQIADIVGPRSLERLKHIMDKVKTKTHHDDVLAKIKDLGI